LNKIVDCPTTPPFASILLFLHSVTIYNTTTATMEEDNIVERILQPFLKIRILKPCLIEMGSIKK
jgi:hypothetical protein